MQSVGLENVQCLQVQSRAVSYGYVPPPPAIGSSGAAPMPPPPAKSSRKTVWIIVSAVFGVGLLVVLFVVGIMAAVFGAMKSNEPYRHSVDIAVHDPLVIRALGAPVVPGWLPSGSINLNGDSGEADLSIPLKGSLHSGTLYVTARRAERIWSYQNMAVRVEGTDKRINLLPLTLSPVQ